jgi:hypothetical protein
VILVNLTIDGDLLLLELGTGDMLLSDSWVDGLNQCEYESRLKVKMMTYLVDCRVVLSILVEESGNGLLCFIHFD